MVDIVLFKEQFRRYSLNLDGGNASQNEPVGVHLRGGRRVVCAVGCKCLAGPITDKKLIYISHKYKVILLVFNI